MKNILLKIISFLGLLLTLLPSFFTFAGTIDMATNQWLMLIGTIIWFISVPFWMNRSVSN